MLNKGVNSATLSSVSNKVRNVTPISNANISFENPLEEESFGKVIGDFVGIPKLIHITFNGNIRINPDYEINPNFKILAYYDKKTILVRNKPIDNITGNECLFEYTGYIKNLTTVNVYGYSGKTIYLRYRDHLKYNWANKEATWFTCDDIWNPDEPEVPNERLNKIRLQIRRRSLEKLKPLRSYKRKELLGLSKKLGGPNYFSKIGDENK